MCKSYIHWLPLAHPQLGTWPATWACAPTGNQTSDALVPRLALNPLSHTSQGHICVLKLFISQRHGNQSLLAKQKRRKSEVLNMVPHYFLKGFSKTTIQRQEQAESTYYIGR